MQGVTIPEQANQMPDRTIYIFQINPIFAYFIILMKMEYLKGSPFKYQEERQRRKY